MDFCLFGGIWFDVEHVNHHKLMDTAYWNGYFIPWWWLARLCKSSIVRMPVEFSQMFVMCQCSLNLNRKIKGDYFSFRLICLACGKFVWLRIVELNINLPISIGSVGHVRDRTRKSLCAIPYYVIQTQCSKTLHHCPQSTLHLSIRRHPCKRFLGTQSPEISWHTCRL